MKFKKLLNKIVFEKRWRYLLTGSNVTVEKGAVFKVGKKTKIKNCNIYVKKGDRLILGNNINLRNVGLTLMVPWGFNDVKIGDNCSISDYDINVTKGCIDIGSYNILDKADEAKKPTLEIFGEFSLGHYNRLRCTVKTRFMGKVKIGDRNAINERTEIRSDEAINIGSYNQISYDCVFWDTNTHNLYKAEKRRDITDEQYPSFGLEYEKPKTAPINIGDDCWIGRGVSVLKGTNVSNKCVVAYGTLLSNITIEENKTVFNQSSLKIIDNQI
ncbi:hypothetical protein PK35_02270 [Tamlana nanhaiensis]|uniref:Transferase n=1 Tax=Neotamlana nanhaiensis TaxID=1382798 RepID=A0A0D7W672_9FLAO|nr:hypothetical protein [Tamlana nanhaiensis]KJD34625.1 hypothetical protein PK35_02270 [Tamlana nanhaiensis]